MSTELWVTTKMTGKMAGMVSINTNSLDNPYCKTMAKNPKFICKHCYACRTLQRYKTAQKRYHENGVLLSSPRLNFRIPFLNYPCVRLHSFGELINSHHLKNFYKIAKHNKNTTFVLWTKRLGLVHRVLPKPKNMILIYSEPTLNKLNPKVPPGFDKTFCVYTKDFVDQHKIKINCKQKCVDCFLCYDKEIGKNHKIIRELKK